MFLLFSLAALIVPVARAGTASATNDAHWGRQWAPPKIGAPSAWASTTGAGVKIGVVDSGVDLAHQDLQGGKIAANARCIDTEGDTSKCVRGEGQDVDGHGTHVSGIAAANKDNGVGIAGIAPSAQLVVARVFQGDTARLEDVEAGIRWALDQGARVVNLSLGELRLPLGLLGGDASLAPVLEEAWSRGAIPVVAAGNADLLFGSASYGNVNAVIVGATGPDDEVAGYSEPTGDAKWALVAPGGNGPEGSVRQIYSTYWRQDAANQYGYLQGTSMAAPHVSGALALLLAKGVSQQRAVELVLATANRAVKCGSTCAGRLDAGAAVAALNGPSTTTTAATSPPASTSNAAGATTTTAAASGASAPPAAGRTARTTPRRTSGAPTTVAAPPTAGETTLPAPPSTDVVAPPATDPVAPESTRLQAAPARSEGDDDVGVPGAAAALLLAGVAAASVLARRRTG